MEGVEVRKPPSTHVPEDVPDDVLFQYHIAPGVNFDRYFDIAVEVSGNSADENLLIKYVLMAR